MLEGYLYEMDPGTIWVLNGTACKLSGVVNVNVFFIAANRHY